MQPSPTMIATVASIFTSACTATTWASTSITIRFPISMRAMGRQISCCTTKEMRAFVERTEAAGLNADNDRYSFACAWGDSSSNGLPDLYVANDFGRSNLYRNNGDGTFTVDLRHGPRRGCRRGNERLLVRFRQRRPSGHLRQRACGRPRAKEFQTQKHFHENAPEEYSRTLPAARARQCALSKPRGRTVSKRQPAGRS